MTNEHWFIGHEEFASSRAGKKAATLHDLARAGFRVPPGFVLDHDVVLDDLDDDLLTECVETLGGFPVAVRSSGAMEDLDDASFAGQYDSYLDVADVTALRARIVDCRESAQNERVQDYLRRAGRDPRLATVTVFVQRQVDARTAGVGFSIDPISGHEDIGLVECCQGLGERLVSGAVNPLRLHLNLRDGAVVERAEGSEEVEISADECVALASLLRAVQADRGRPQDIEWAIGGDGTLWLLQSRAITAIGWRQDVEQFTDADFRDGGVSARVCTTMMYSLYENAFAANMQNFFTDLHLLGRDEKPNWIAMFYGRPYWNADAVKRCLTSIPGFDEKDFDLDLGVTKDYGEAGPHRTPTTVSTAVRAIPTALAFSKGKARQLDVVKEFSAGWPAVQAKWAERVQALPEADNETFAEQLRECLVEFHAHTETQYFLTIYFNTLVQGDFKSFLAKVDGSTDQQTTVIDLLGGLTEVSHMELQQAIIELYEVGNRSGTHGSEWDAALTKFLDEQGFHADTELDLMCPRWSETPSTVRNLIDGMIAGGTPPIDPQAGQAAQRARFEAAAADIRSRIRSDIRKRVQYSRSFTTQLTLARKYLVARERMRDFSTQCYAVVRAYLVEAGRRMADDGRLRDPSEVFMLTYRELADVWSGRMDWDVVRHDVDYRLQMYRGYRDATPPHELGNSVSEPPMPESGSALVGVGCSPGVVEGTARVIPKIGDVHQLRSGDILVTTVTDPGWTPALGLVSGVVTEVGGMLSHAAVIGREYGLPAVLNVPGATVRIESGQKIRVDGSAGTVEILDDVPVDDRKGSLAGAT